MKTRLQIFICDSTDDKSLCLFSKNVENFAPVDGMKVEDAAFQGSESDVEVKDVVICFDREGEVSQRIELEDHICEGSRSFSKTLGQYKDNGWEQVKDVCRAGSNMVISEDGLLPKEVVWDVMRGYPRELVMEFRDRLNAKCIGLKEKLNRNNRCLGYARVGRSDAFYIYVQKKRLLIDVRVSPDRSDELGRKGFEVKYRNNFQGRAGWLTGLLVPHDTANLDVIVDLAVEALHG